MEWREVLERMKQGEDERTELKRGPGDLKAVGRTIAAFANSIGGLLILGANDRGEVVGVHGQSEGPAERLTSSLQSGIGSKILLEVFSDRVVVTSPGRLPKFMAAQVQ